MVSKSPHSFRTNAKEPTFLCAPAPPVAPFGCGPIMHCSVTPHECLQAVARADWMKGSLLFACKKKKKKRKTVDIANYTKGFSW